MAEEPTDIETAEAPEPESLPLVEPSGTVALRDRYQIDLSQPLRDLDMPNARAFGCTDKRAPSRPLYALLVTGPLPPRIRTATTLQGVDSPGMLELVEWGVVEWAPTKGRIVAVVYDRPLGGRVMATMGATFDPLKERDFMKGVVRPLLRVMEEFAGRGIVHRAIRPTNFYWADKEKTRIVLGDGVTSSPAYDQPVLCEPIESGMADPSGRGVDTPASDMYALGVSLVALSLGRMSQARLAESTILTMKINSGSFATVVGEDRVPLDLIELMRGLLLDDARKRWTLDDVDSWMAGRRGKSLTDVQERRAQRPFSFKEKEYSTARALAHALSCNWDESVDLLMGGKVELWVRRGLEMPEMADSILKVLAFANVKAGDPIVARDFAMAAILLLMDPRAPIRLKSNRFHIDALGAALACAMATKGDIRPYVEVVRRQFVNRWIEAQGDLSGVDMSRLENRFKELRSYLVDTEKGAGVERLLYEANGALSCRSPLVKNQCVFDIQDLLPALETVASTVDQTLWPTDRHITAFVASRFRRDSEVQIGAMNSASPQQAALGALSLLGVLQWKFGPESLPNLTAWVAKLMSSVIESYHSRERRKVLEKEIPAIVKKGHLPKLYHLLDDPKERQIDFDGFFEAEKEYAQITKRVADLKAGNYKATEEAQRKGQQAAAFVAMVVAFASLALTGLSYL